MKQGWLDVAWIMGLLFLANSTNGQSIGFLDRKAVYSDSKNQKQTNKMKALGLRGWHGKGAK